MEKKKLNLSDLKVQSFVTSLNNSAQKTIQGGTGQTVNPACATLVAGCQSQAAICQSQGAGCSSGGPICYPECTMPMYCGTL